MVVLKRLVFKRHRRGGCSQRNRLTGAEFFHRAMSYPGHAVHPGHNSRRGVKNLCQDRGANAGEPQRVKHRKVGDARRIAQQEGRLIQHVRQAAQEGLVGTGGVSGPQPHHAGAHGLAVVCKSFGGFRRNVGKHVRETFGLKVVGHGGPEQRVVGPVGQHTRHTFAVGGVQRRLWCQGLQHIGDQRGVAINVSANLQYGCFAVTARQGNHLRLGHDGGNDDRLPGQLFVAQHEPGFFAER